VIYKRIPTIAASSSKAFNLITSNPSVGKLLDELGRMSKKINTLSLQMITLIFFCGRPYPCFIYKSEDKQGNTRVHHCYSIEDVRLTVNKYGTKEQQRRWNGKKSKWEWFTSKQEIWVPKIFALAEQLKHDEHSYALHHKLGIPIFAYVMTFGKQYILLNPTLKKYKFYKVVDTYTAFQKISMFISGVLGGTSPPVIEVSNAIKISKHGYDKWSFRKEPWKH